MDIKEYKEYLESEVLGYRDTEESSEYDKIQVLREAVEERFLNDELTYEEYAMVIERLDEKETYSDPRLKKIMQPIDKYIMGKDPDKISQSDIDKFILATHDNDEERKAFGVGLDDLFPGHTDKLRRKYQNQTSQKPKKDDKPITINHHINKDSRADVVDNKKDDNKSKSESSKKNDVKRRSSLSEQTSKIIENDKKTHKKMIALISAATAVGLGVGIKALVATKRQNADKMYKDLMLSQDRLTDLATERRTTLNLLNHDRELLEKIPVNGVEKYIKLKSEIKNNEQKLVKIDREILSLTRKVEVIKAKLEKMKKKVD